MATSQISTRILNDYVWISILQTNNISRIFIMHTSYIRYNIAPSPKARSRDFEFHLNCPIVLFLHDEVSSGNLL